MGCAKSRRGRRRNHPRRSSRRRRRGRGRYPSCLSHHRSSSRYSPSANAPSRRRWRRGRSHLPRISHSTTSTEGRGPDESPATITKASSPSTESTTSSARWESPCIQPSRPVVLHSRIRRASGLRRRSVAAIHSEVYVLLYFFSLPQI